jgi:hypothetical protein
MIFRAGTPLEQHLSFFIVQENAECPMQQASPVHARFIAFTGFSSVAVNQYEAIFFHLPLKQHTK